MINQSVIRNDRFEILTPSGWSSFDGIVRSQKQTVKITFTDQRHLTCTPNHKILCKNGWFVDARTLKPKDVLASGRQVVKIERFHTTSVYDPINVVLGNRYLSSGEVSHNCNFLGSSLTLIAGDYLAKMSPHEFEYQKDSLDILVPPQKGRIYTIVVDTSRGLDQDASAFTVIDSTELPYKLVAKYKNNQIAPRLYPSVIYKVGKDYNDAFVLVEINDNGQQIADILYGDLEYENMLFVSREKGGQRLSAGFKGQSSPGVRTDKLVKRVGCTTLRELVHENKLLIHDPDIIRELSTFVETKGSYAADEGYHDDLVMCLVLFAWMTTNPFFRDLMNVDMRESIYKQRIENIEAELTPFGFIVDGNEKDEPKYVKEDGDLWTAVEYARNDLIEGLALDEWGWS